MHADILIAGAGPAGLNAAKAARKSGRQVVLAGAEPFLPYWRPRLPDIIHTGAAAAKKKFIIKPQRLGHIIS